MRAKLKVFYKDFLAVSGEVEAKFGEVIGFIGPDGAGKSSFMKALAGVKEFVGEIEYFDKKYTKMKYLERIKDKIGFMPQGLGLVLYDFLSVKEHIEFFRDLRGIKKDIEYENRLLKMAGLDKFLDRRAKNLSGGMRQKLSLILTLLHKPKILILDEPTTGVDPISRAELWEIVNEMKSEMIAFVSTSYMSEASKMDRVYVFDEGEIIESGKSEELTQKIKDYVYKGEFECDGCISAFNKTYSIKPLNKPKAKPSLEGVFFINAIKKNKIPPKIKLPKENIPLPDIVLKGVNLTKKFGSFIADDHINIELKKGEILGLLGANGAGKTTLIKMILGLYPIDEGELYLLGEKVKNNRDKLKKSIGYMSQLFSLYDDLTIYENMRYFGKLRGVENLEEEIKKYAKFLGFIEYLHFYPKELPLGINQRFSLALSIFHKPKILILDEPTSGVDPIARSQFWKILREIKLNWGISILVTTHYMNEAEYCDRVVVLKRGKKILDEEVKALLKKYNTDDFEEIFLKVYSESN